GGVAEYVERTTAQTLESGQHAEGLEHPRAVFGLAQIALGVLLRQQGRREMEMDLEVALESLADLLLEIAAGVEPGDFVFVLVGHQLEGVPSDRPAQGVEARRAFLLDPAHLVDQGQITLRVRRILVAGEELRA